MQILGHHIYEYKKGLRRMVLYTTSRDKLYLAENKLKSQGIDYYITYPGERNINIFFGDPLCIEVIKGFKPENLNLLTLEQDFILGALLGYDIKVQCNRYLERCRDKEIKVS